MKICFAALSQRGRNVHPTPNVNKVCRTGLKNGMDFSKPCTS